MKISPSKKEKSSLKEYIERYFEKKYWGEEWEVQKIHYGFLKENYILVRQNPKSLPFIAITFREFFSLLEEENKKKILIELY